MGNRTKLITITANSRLHLTLIAMNKGGYRINGGIGLAITEPNVIVTAKASSFFTAIDNRQKKLNTDQANRLSKNINSIQKKLNLKCNISIMLDGDMISNSGFGSGTTIRLACIEALLILNEYDYNEELLVSLSGRGGTSGIGIRTYFHGGFVIDIGHKNSRKIQPSNSIEGHTHQSLLLENGQMPNWDIGICLDKRINTLSQKEEKAFFKNTVPISDSEVYKTLYHVVDGLYAAIKENDLKTFSSSLVEIQKCAWKKAERNIYGEKIKKLEKLLYKCGAHAVGMSSLGPSLLFLSDNNNKVVKRMKQEINNYPIILLNSKTINSGRSIIIC